MRRLDLLIAVVVIALAAFAVVSQLGSGPEQPNDGGFVRPIGLGEALDPDVTLRDLEGAPRRIGDLYGSTATILYSWSTTCPCIPACEERMREVFGRFGGEQGFSWVAIGGEPTDTPEGVAEEMRRLGSFYEMLLDPGHRLCRRLGIDQAAVLVVLDGDGVVRFRGNLNDDLKNPSRNYLVEAFEALAAGEEPEVRDMEELVYGCAFSAPIECEDDELLGTAGTAAPSAP